MCAVSVAKALARNPFSSFIKGHTRGRSMFAGSVSEALATSQISSDPEDTLRREALRMQGVWARLF